MIADYTETMSSLTLLQILESTKKHPDSMYKNSRQSKRIRRIEQVLRQRRVIK